MHNARSISLVGTAVLAVALLFAWAGPAEAQRTRYKRDVKIKVKVKQTDKTKELKAKSEDKSELKPELTADDFISVLGKVGHIRAAQIEALKLLIEDTDQDNPELPDLHFRLGEMYSQQSRYWNFRGMEMHDKINKAKNKSTKNSYAKKQKQYFGESKKYLVRAIKQYKNLFCHPKDLGAGLNCKPNPNFRNFPRMDTALFYFAFTLQTAKQMTDARKVYARLVKDYPKSKHIPDAFLSFAEYYFGQGQLANAERFYDKVLKFPKAPVYTYALYKKGWVFLNLDKNQEAYEVFTKVAKMTNGNKSKKTINLAAKKDSVRAYSEMGRAETAYKAFQRVDSKYAPTMLQILGNIYIEKGKAAKAIYTFRELIGIEPKNKLVCEWQYNVVHAMLSIGDRKQKVDEIENLVKLNTFLKKKKVLPGPQQAECQENAIAVNSEMAKIWHNEAMKTLNTDTLGDVERLYHLFLNNFQDSPEYSEMQYYYAELLWQRAQNEKEPRLATEMWEKAAGAFTDVVKAGKGDKKMLKESAYAAVLGWKNALDVDPRKGISEVPTKLEGEGDKIPEPKEIPEREAKMVDAFDIYITYVKDPKDEELVMMKFLKARLYWRYNQFDKAVPLFEEIVKEHQKHETAEFSINLLLDTFNRTKDYKKMIWWVNYLLEKQSHLKEKEDLWARLNQLKRQAMRKDAETLEKDKKYVDCGKAYLDIFNMDPNSEDAHEVLYNSGVCFQDGMSMGAARTVFNILSKRYPNEKVTQKAIARLGYIYGRIAWYDKAAAKLEEYAKKFGGEDDAYKALNDAVFYYKGIGEDDNAIRSTKFFVKQYGKKKPAEAANAHFSLVTIYEKQGDDDKVVRHLNEYLKTHGRKGGVDRQVIAHVKIGKILWRDSCPLKGGVDGACVKIKRERAIASKRKSKKRKKGADLPTQCGPESKVRTVVVDRDRGRARKARQEFAAAVKLFKGGKALAQVPGDDEAEKAARQERMIESYAAAMFYLAEQDYESYLAIKFPSNLNFDPNKKKVLEKSKKLFNDWLEEKTYQMLLLTASGGEDNPKKKGKKMGVGSYREVVGITGGGADWAIAAAARAGQVAQNFSDALFTVTIPSNVRTGPYAEDAVYAYCDALTEAATPLEDKSIAAFGFCLDTSTKLNWFNSWSKLCERELGQIRPEQFPTASELHVEAEELAPITDVEPAQLELITE